MLKIKKQILKYVKSIKNLVKNWGEGGYLAYQPPSQKFGGDTSPSSSRDLRPCSCTPDFKSWYLQPPCL